MGDAANGEGYDVWGQSIYENSLCLPLNFDVNLKLLYKKQSPIKKINSNPATYSNFLSSADTADFSAGHSLSIRAWYIRGKNFTLDVLNP